MAVLRQFRRVVIASLGFAIVSMFFGGAALSGETIHKWVDKEGKVHYGDVPNAPVTPQDPAKNAKAYKPEVAKPMDDATWNRAVDRAEQAPTGGSGRNLIEFAGADRLSVPRTTTTTRTYTQTYSPGVSNALSQSEAERRFYQQQKQQEEARENYRKQLIAECERQRGTDCRSESTIRYMDAMNKPRGPGR